MKDQKIKVALILIMFALLVVGSGAYFLIHSKTSPDVTANTYGMVQYTDSDFDFAFWYPNSWQVLSTTTKDTVSFPGGTLVKTLQVGSPGDVTIFVVTSMDQAITDEQKNHASPIGQTKYFYDSASQQWMVAYPEGGATTTANVSNTTMSGLIMLSSGRRFDTSIIPLSTTNFLVVSSGGGSNASVLAKTVSLTGARVDPTIFSATLQAEANAYANIQPTPTPGTNTGPVVGAGEHCGGFIRNAPVCTTGFYCQLTVSNPDIGGTCIADPTDGGGSGILPFQSGIHGTVMLGPSCPVMRNPPDPQCADKPYQTAISISHASSPAQVFATAKSAADGTFTLSLPPGDYIVSAAGGTTLPRCTNTSATVGSSGYTQVQVSCDTGIR